MTKVVTGGAANSSGRPRQVLVFLALAVWLQTQLQAAIKTWTGGGAPNGNWMLAANWGGTAPLEGDGLIFPPGVALLNTTNNFPSNTLFSAVNIGGLDYAIYGNLFRVVNGITNINPGGSNTIFAPIRLNDSLAITASGGTLRLHGGIDLNFSTVTFQGAGTTQVGGASSIFNTGNVVKTGP